VSQHDLMKVMSSVAGWHIEQNTENKNSMVYF